MKKIVYALLISSSLISAAFAAKSRSVISSLEAASSAAQPALQTAASDLSSAASSVEGVVNPAMDEAIDAAAAHTTNSKALDVLAWMKNNKAATVAIGLGGLAGMDILWHWFNHDEDEDQTVWEQTLTKRHVVDNVTNMPGRCLGYTVALVAAVLIAHDLTKDEKASYIKNIFEQLTGSNSAASTDAVTPAPVASTPAAN